VPAARKARIWKQVVLLLAAALLVFLVALGSNRPSSSAILVQRSLDRGLVINVAFVALVGCCLVAFGVLAYMLLGTMRGPWRSPARPARSTQPWWMQALGGAVALACIAGCVLLVVYSRGDVVTPPIEPPVGPLLPGEVTSAAGDAPVVLQWWPLVMVVVLVLAALALAYVLARRRRRPFEDDETAIERRELLAAVETSLTDLGQAFDCRAAVIRAYATMEKVLAGHGLARRGSEAPFEYMARWTAALDVGRSTATVLTTLYEWAKFSPHSVDEDMKQRATEALSALQHDLGGY
jgi:hypothetical protein